MPTKREKHIPLTILPEKIYQTIFEQSPISTQVFSPDGWTIRVNKAWEQLWGFTLEQIGGYNILQDQQLVKKGIMKFIKKGFSGEYTAIPAIKYEPSQTVGEGNGVSYRWVRAVIYPVKNERGDIEEVVLMHEDITDQKEVQEHLKESEERYRNLIEMAPDVIYTIDMKGNFLSLTPSFEKFTGWKATDWIGKQFTGLIHPDDRALAIRKFREGLQTKTSEPYELRIKTAKGDYLYGEFRSGPMKSEKGINGKIGIARDITRRKLTEQELERSRLQMEIILRGVADGITMQDASGKLLFVNDQAAKSSGYPSAKAMLAAPSMEFMKRFTICDTTGEQLTLEKLPGRRALQGEKDPEELVCYWDKKSGKKRWVQIKARPVFDDDKVLYAINIMHDVTDIKEADEQLRFQANILHNVTDSIIVTDLFGKIMYWNNGAQRIFGYTAKEMLGKSPALLYPEMDAKQLSKDLKKIIQGKDYIGEWKGKRKNGELIWVDVRTTLLKNATGEVNGFIGVAVDVTGRRKAENQLRESEKRFRTFTDFAPVGIFQTDPEGNCLFVNKRWREMAGMSLEEAKGHGWVKALHPDDRDRVAKEWYEAAKENKEFLSAYRFQTPKGKVTWLQGNAIGLYDDAGKLVGYLGTIIDINVQKNVEKQKDEFIGIASHELKTPVTSLKAYTQALEKRFSKVGDAKSAEQLAKMDSQLDKLTNLIGDLLDVTKIETGKMQFHEKYFALQPLVSEIMEEMQRTTDRHKLILKRKAKKKVYGDRERIGQVLINLISNAIKYSPKADQVEIRLSENTSSVTCCVRDFGVGIADEDKERVFERFYRVSEPGQDTYPGLGLGLYISSEIVKRHHGTIWVESIKRNGSMFCFSLPLTKKKLPEKL